MLRTIGKMLGWLALFLLVSAAMYPVLFFGSIAGIGALARHLHFDSSSRLLPLLFTLSAIGAMIVGGIIASKVVRLGSGGKTGDP